MKRTFILLFAIIPIFSYSQNPFNVNLGEANSSEQMFLIGKFPDANCDHVGACTNECNKNFNEARKWCTTGQFRIENNDFRLAIVDFGIALKIDKKYAAIYFYRGNANFLQGYFGDAIKDYDEYLNLIKSTNRNTLVGDPSDRESEAYLYRAVSKIKLGNSADGCSDLIKSAELGNQKAISFKEKLCSPQALTSSQIFASNETVKIGNQFWQKKNLNVSTFRNGDTILEANTIEAWHYACSYNIPAWCYYNQDKKNGDTYGKLYNWYAVHDPRGLAPEGYHIPTQEEFGKLFTFLGGKYVLYYNIENVSPKLKNTSGWEHLVPQDRNCPTCFNWPLTDRNNKTCNTCSNKRRIPASPKIYNTNGNNNSGFTAIPGGYRNPVFNNSTFDNLGESCWFWTSSWPEDNVIKSNGLYLITMAYYVSLDVYSNDLKVQKEYSDYGMSVRCIKD